MKINSFRIYCYIHMVFWDFREIHKADLHQRYLYSLIEALTHEY